MIIRVQIQTVTHAALLNGLPNEGDYLTFHAYSERMQGKVLESLVDNADGTIFLSQFDGEPKAGEWFEPLAPDARCLDF